MMKKKRVTVKQMRKENNERRRELSRENRIYYTRLLTYMRMGSWFHNNREREELLLEILYDVLEAQADGVSAEEFFGKEPKEVADEMLKRISMKVSEGIKLFGIIFSISFIFTSLGGFLHPEAGINLVSIVIQFVITSGIVSIFFRLMQKGVYQESILEGVKGTLLVLAAFSALVGPVVLLEVYGSESWSIYPSQVLSIGALSLIAVGASIVLFFMSKEERLGWIGLLPIPWMYLLIGILNHWSRTRPWMEEQRMLQAIVPLIFVSVCSLLNIKSVKDSDDEEVQFERSLHQ